MTEPKTASCSYWAESVESSLGEAGVAATEEQIASIAEDMEVSHEQFDMAFGYDVASANLRGAKDDEIANLERLLHEEKDKIACPNCGGCGRIKIQGPYHSSESECSKCRGEGRIAR